MNVHTDNSIGTICDGESCGNAISPIGDGSTPFCSSPEGGKYFCSEGCKKVYMQANISLMELLTQAFEKTEMPNPPLAATVFLKALSPTFIEVTDAKDVAAGRRRFSSTIVPAASLISCILSGDKSFAAHVGTEGIVHTPLRIGDFANVVSTVAPGSLLREIKLVKFNKPIALGETVIITATDITYKRNRHVAGCADYSVVAHLMTGEPVSRPSTVTVYTAQ